MQSSQHYKERRSRRSSETIVYDDGTNTFLWRTHTVLSLLIIISFLTYTVITEEESQDVEYNVKRGICAGVFMFLAIGVTQVKDGPFKRPHPILWRFVFCASILYEIGILFMLFQSVDHARSFLTYIDPDLNKPLDFRAYGGNCTIWDAENERDPLHNVMDKMDGFVAAHFIGWFLKALIFRNIWMTTVLSAVFELLEYTLEHQLPNFSECWWDHWILDFIVCNGLGIYFGLKCLKYLSVKEYKWQGLWHIPSYRGKVRRVVGQFSPYSWVKFQWKPTENLFRWLLVSFQMLMILLAELNTFYLKFVLWMPPDHPFVLTRLVFFWLWGGVAVREMYDYMGGVAHQFGQQAWMVVMIIATEFLMVVKFGWNTITLPFPGYIKAFWGGAFLLYIAWTIWKFQMKFPRFKAMVKETTSKAIVDCDAGESTSNEEVGFDSTSLLDNNRKAKHVRRRDIHSNGTHHAIQD
ncbi:phosphatidylserine synthase 2-like [Styela clava]